MYFVAVCVLCLFLAVPWVDLESVIVVFSGHTPLLLFFPANKDKDTDQTARLRRQFSAFVFSRVTKSGFLAAHIVYITHL